MKLKLHHKNKQVKYFNLRLIVPAYAKAIAFDADGMIWAYSHTPVFEDGFWDCYYSLDDVNLQREYVGRVDEKHSLCASASLQLIA